MEVLTKIINGVELPCIGFGPGIAGYSAKYQPKKQSIVYRAYNKFISRPIVNCKYVDSVSNAICNGFRLIDYSAAYGDASLIDKAIRNSGVDRKNLVLTTRVSNTAQFNNCVEEEFFSQLKNLKTDYIDILMFHWPVTEKYEATWLKMVELYKKGYVRILGVANCKEHHLKNIMRISDVKPQINQFEVHPLFTQKDLIYFCNQEEILVEAYTPIARFDDRLMRLPILKEIANKYKKTITQVILRWHIQNGVIPVVRTLSNSHQIENLGIFDFCLLDEEIKTIDSININSRLRYDPDNCDFRIL